MPSLSDPVYHALAVTPSDSHGLQGAGSTPWGQSTAVYVGGSGDLKVITAGGDTVTFPGLPVGWHPIRCTKIFATGTTATNIVAARGQ